ncbi:ABC-type transport auxiliary lipoprotein family protein [Nitrosospira sp. Nsp13]|jgi:cholesterol transport system auxiliary component|uniref:ABC-type transport auxiliary lipoprotein family protein n=1 Tax=Nitrosospira sp. Nsp13 TaxID=1855332 RepID=UPI000891DA37|nr:ABC-type transport auxiliary lipoprotein family protein [Nitrosospira sp. Nsp13]SCY03563.1 cholesterol transport system auxiliary component [Nitrosospira sp. Nsp13]
MTIFLFPVLAVLLLAGCATPRAQVPTAVYDFGLEQPFIASGATDKSSNPPHLFTSLLVAATSPAWLDNPTIQYRLVYHDPARSYTYANSRWAAAPATLLTQRVKGYIAGVSNERVVSAGDGVRADYILRLELEEFTQIFDTPHQSRAVIRLRASLIERSTRSLLAQRSFSTEQAAPTANAAGAVRGLTEASDKLIENLISWLAEKLPEEAKELAENP